MNNTSVDSYLREGCGRCDRFQTPDCKVHRWTEILTALRALLKGFELVEEMKWGSPCYTLEGKNVVMLASLEACCSLSFFKGAALADEAGLLEKPGPNTRLARVVRFRSLEELIGVRQQVARLIEGAIEAERAGTKIAPAGEREPVPVELEMRLAADPELRRAFAALTPGRQRSHLLYISAAKKSETRVKRVERCASKIVAGRGFHER